MHQLSSPLQLRYKKIKKKKLKKGRTRVEAFTHAVRLCAWHGMDAPLPPPPRTMSVPRPAMLVAMVTECALPACATISASFAAGA